jgi:hypothetical protein
MARVATSRVLRRVADGLVRVGRVGRMDIDDSYGVGRPVTWHKLRRPPPCEASDDCLPQKRTSVRSAI